DVVFLHDRLHEFRRLRSLARALLGKNDVVPDELSLAIQDDHFASRPKAGIDREHGLLSERGSEEQFAEVACENSNGLLVGFLFEAQPRLAFHGETEQALVAVMHRFADVLRGGGAVLDEQMLKDREGVLLGRREARQQESLSLA